jgi:Glycosyl transferases group 1
MSWFVGEVKDRGLSNHVEVLGELAQGQVARDVYKVADALLITSSWETGPIVAWEAMAHGKVVITSKFIGSGKEGGLIEGHNCLMFDNGDIASAVDCITQLGNKKNRELLIRNAWSVVGTRYSRDQSIEAWAEQLRTVMRLAPRDSRELQLGCRDSTGRLDRVFGTRLGERIRKILRREFVHQEAGSEWPHTYTKIQDDDMDFLSVAGSIDRR